ncbi:hypothetical protein [Pseudofrankia sp. DC12]|uniref:hypothetical protein n=1 Tax=Pseudofrankia sp. DC12 TaxID=683315 RepID=UPI0005F817AC|nr:hypothetical protein [Pseudofrankia sp. DC12]
MSAYQVTYGERFLSTAKATFPEFRGMEYGGPTFDDFMRLPVGAARLAFGQDWEGQPSVTGSSARMVFLPPSGIFGPIVFYAVLVARPTGPVVEITDFVADQDFYENLDDPDDED